MDFLGIGVLELIVILILALIFIGPRDMPKMAGRAAKFLRDLRQMSEGFTTEWQRELNATVSLDELKQLKEEMAATKKTLQSITTGVASVGDDLKNTVQAAVPTNTIAPPKPADSPSVNSPNSNESNAVDADAPPPESPQPQPAAENASDAVEEAPQAVEDTANRD